MPQGSEMKTRVSQNGIIDTHFGIFVGGYFTSLGENENETPSSRKCNKFARIDHVKV